jgi:hypothetical protein
MYLKQLIVSSSFALRAAGLIAIIAVSFASGCGGGGGGGGGSDTPSVEYLEITSANAIDVAGVVVETVSGSLDLADAGDIAGGSADATAFVVNRAVLQPLRQQTLGAGILEAFGPVTDPCLVAGTITFSADLADPSTISEGDKITGDFENCDDGDGAVTDGKLELVILAIEGDPLADVFLLQADVSLTDLAITEGGETITGDGRFELTVDQLLYPDVLTRLVSDSLTIIAEGDTRTLTKYSTTAEANFAVSPSPSQVTARGTLASRVLDGKVDFATPVPLEGPFGDAPDSGTIRITGLNDATIRVVVLGPASVELRIDLDGDGTVDEVQLSTWEELGGTVAPGVTEGNARTLASEAIAADLSYQKLVRDAGAQFDTTGAFTNAALGINEAGSFGPVSIRCQLSASSATVSGTVLVARAPFSVTDVFNGSFVDCLQATPPGQTTLVSTLVNGSLDATITAYSGASFPFDYSIEFDAIASDFQDATASFTATYNANGAAGNSYEGATPVVQLSGPRALYDATVTGQYDQTVSPARLTRSVSGDLYTAQIAGRFILETPVPLISYATGGPSEGELLLTADNGTSVRVVAIDAGLAQLRLDLDGNGSVDQSFSVPWQDLILQN